MIAVFPRSLTAHWHGRIIAVIVSGFDGDGAAPLCEIRDIGGTTIAQRLKTAAALGMPQSAIETGCIDYVLATGELALRVMNTMARTVSVMRGATAAISGRKVVSTKITTSPAWLMM